MRKYLRFVRGLMKYFKNRIKPEEAIAKATTLLSERYAARNGNFLNLIEKGVFGYKKSPYLPLLEAKKITYADVKKWVENEGIETALVRLHREGVYFTVDEFKGKIPVKRGGVSFTCAEKMFDNPFLAVAYEVRSGATRSAGTRIRIDFDYLVQRSLYDAFLLNIHDVLTAPIANWFPLFPGAPGINSSLRFSHIGNPPKKWFSQVKKAQIKVNWEKRLGTELIFFIGRLYGVPLAKPEYVNLNYAHTVAQWAATMVAEHGTCVVYTFATSAVRVCMAAAEAGLNIKGVRFLVTGEPLTAQKKTEIEAAGAIAVPVYGISEAGVIAAGCNRHSAISDDCHLFKDTTAVIPHQHQVEHFDTTVNSFLFTSLLYEAPKLLLNVGMGDYGTVEEKPCDCAFGKIGFHTHLSRIRSYEKLTGEGVTFVDTDFIRIIEKDLPHLFGGASTDYQLIEEEDAKGISHLHLIVSPRLNGIDEDKIVESFIGLLKTSEASPESWAQSGTVMWNQARTLRVKREFPVATASGKILPFHLVRRQTVAPTIM